MTGGRVVGVMECMRYFDLVAEVQLFSHLAQVATGEDRVKADARCDEALDEVLALCRRVGVASDGTQHATFLRSLEHHADAARRRSESRTGKTVRGGLLDGPPSR